MLTVIVGHDIWMLQGMQDGEFCLKLFPFLVRHANIIDFFPAEDLDKSVTGDIGEGDCCIHDRLSLS